METKNTSTITDAKSAELNGDLAKNKVEAWDTLFAGSAETAGKKAILDQPVEAAFARECADAYVQLFDSNADAEILRKSRTDSVDFAGRELENWFSGLKWTTNYNRLRIVLGVYTNEILARHGYDVEIGDSPRITLFLWPYNGDEPAQDKQLSDARPYNLGHINP